MTQRIRKPQPETFISGLGNGGRLGARSTSYGCLVVEECAGVYEGVSQSHRIPGLEEREEAGYRVGGCEAGLPTPSEGPKL